ncbi:ROK family transcriptional regulator [Maribrevibacterium harenarium]|uniref:ROK family transcriptional regulator n=1 Tax=Maribrevibacterium harenarium TaxID=2589817 RepID=A0A501WTC9_9GAMM|nr:ROK family transcriptional regulator [Maribrevibacterium harenarium]TPE50577.1 ROK family transcriptional regulator [Maribrevibacterium harenarium]
MRNATSTSEQSRLFNERIILNVIRNEPGIARADIALLTGLSAQSISVICHSLLERELIQVRGKTKGRRGQPRIELELNGQGAFAIGINVDRNSISIALVNFLGEVIYTQSSACLFPGEVEAKAVVTELLEQARQELGDYWVKVAGIGFSCPDYMDCWLETMLPAHTSTSDIRRIADRVSYWQYESFETWLGEQTQLRALRENDAVVSALAEKFLATSCPYFLYFFISIATGAAIVSDGEIVRGADGRAGHFGLIPLMDNPFGSCIVEVLSLSGLRRYLEQAGINLSDDWLVTPSQQVMAATEQWGQVIAPIVAPVFASVIAMENPQLMLFGGHLPQWLAQSLLPLIEQATADISLLPVPPFTLAKTAHFSGAIGAALLPLYDTFAPHKSVLIRQG